MAYCVNCGNQLPEGTDICPKCGYVQSLPAAQQPLKENQGSNNIVPEQTPESKQNERPAPVATGGLIAWGIITLLLCTIPGIVGLVQTAGINNCLTYEEQQKKLGSAKTWCTVGTILGGLLLIAALAVRLR